MKYPTIHVYGTEQKCASCVHLPSSYETFEWLLAAISRKYPNENVKIEYIDINRSTTDEYGQMIIERIKNDELFYPVVTIKQEIVAEGNPNLKQLFKRIDAIVNGGTGNETNY